MTNLARLIQNRDGSALSKVIGSAPEPAKMVNPEAEKLVDALFRNLKQVFPAAVSTTFRNPEDEIAAKRQWIAAFAENGIRSREQLSAGMQFARANGSPFWPSPGQFIAWCKQGALKAAGLPDEDELYVMTMKYARRRGGYVSAEAYPWTSSASYWMVTTLYDHMRHENWSDAQLRKGCGTELKLMAKRIEAGEKIPAPVARIPEMSLKSAMSKRQGLEKVAELRARLGLRKATPNAG